MAGSPHKPPARGIKRREDQLISLAADLAQRQLEEGTASPSVITHFLKLGTTNAELERLKLEREIALMSSKEAALESQTRSEDLFQKALDAFASYRSGSDSDEYD